MKKLKVAWYSGRGPTQEMRSLVIEPAEMHSAGSVIVFKDRNNEPLLVIPADLFIQAEVTE